MLLLSFVATTVVANTNYKGFKRAESLISAEQLHMIKEQKRKGLVVIAVASKTQYLTGHIPASLRVDMSEFSLQDQNTLSETVIPRKEFQEFARKLGINDDSLVIIYDYNFEATKLWWSFFHYGKKDVKILDGGMAAWKNAGFNVDYIAQGKPLVEGSFNAHKPPRPIKTAKYLMLKNTQFWNVSPDAKQEDAKNTSLKPLLEKSKPLDWKLFRNPQTGKMKDALSIQQTLENYGVLKTKRQFFYSNTGIGSSQAFFTFYLYGFPVRKLYLFNGVVPELTFLNYEPSADSA
jgi:3-mercaptopyruvate sulfurtransferase SseA